jgi:hypothetical protein
MPVITTGTSEKRRLVSEKICPIVKDTAEALFQGWENLFAKRKAFSSKPLRSSVEDNQWRNIFDKNFAPNMKGIC